MVQRSALCRSRRELSNEYLFAKFGFDTAENEPCKVCPLSAYRSPRSRWPYEWGVEDRGSPAYKRRRPMQPSDFLDLPVAAGHFPVVFNVSHFSHVDGHADDARVRALAVSVRTPVKNIEYFPPNFEGLVLGCIDGDFCKSILF